MAKDLKESSLCSNLFGYVIDRGIKTRKMSLIFFESDLNEQENERKRFQGFLCWEDESESED